MEQDFSPTPRGGAGMGLDFLDPSYHTLPYPFPAPTLLRSALINVIIINFSYPKLYYLNKHINISLFDFTQRCSLPLFCYLLYFEIFIFIVIYLVKYALG